MDKHHEAAKCHSLRMGVSGTSSSATATAVDFQAAKAAGDRRGKVRSLVAPTSGIKLDPERTALVVIDPQIDAVSSTAAGWPGFGKDEAARRTIRNLVRLLQASKHAGITVAISLTASRHEHATSRFVPALTQYIEDGRTIVCSPDAAYSPLAQVNDTGLRLRKRRVELVILAGMVADLGIAFHLRDFLEQGFRVAIVRDAVAGPALPEGTGYLSSRTNFRRIANALWTTKETVRQLVSPRLNRPRLTAAPEE